MLEKMIKKAEEKIKKKKELEAKKKEEEKKEERKNKTPSKAVVAKKKESKMAILNTQAPTSNATPDMGNTTNFIGKKKSKAAPKDDPSQTIQNNQYKASKMSSFNTSVLN